MSRESFLRKINYGDHMNCYDLGDVADARELTKEELNQLLERARRRKGFQATKKGHSEGILASKTTKAKV